MHLTPDIATQLNFFCSFLKELSGVNAVYFECTASENQRVTAGKGIGDGCRIEIVIPTGSLSGLAEVIEDTGSETFSQTTKIGVTTNLNLVIKVLSRSVGFFIPLEVAIGLMSSLSAPLINIGLRPKGLIVSALNENAEGKAPFEFHLNDFDKRLEWEISFGLTLTLVSTVSTPVLDGQWIEHVIWDFASPELSSDLYLTDDEIPPIEGD